MKKEFQLSELKPDEKLLSIRKVNKMIVSKYRQNYREGCVFPLMIIEQGTKRIVSGNHRYAAMLAEYGKEHKVTVIVKKYESEKDVLIDFAKENATHGYAIDGLPKKLLILELSKNGATNQEISKIFNISIRRIEELGSGMVNVIVGGSEEDGNIEIEQRPVKRGFEPPRSISMKEYNDHRTRDCGLPLGQKTNELIRWLSGDLIIRNEINTMKIEDLKTACDIWLGKEKQKTKKVI